MRAVTATTPWVVGLLAACLLGAAPAAAQPRATAADVNYGSLARVGVSASGATVSGRDLAVQIRLRRRAGIRLAVVNGDQIRGYTKRVLAPGSYRFHGQLSRTPAGTNLQLRITARLQDGRRGRQRLPITFVKPTADHAPTAIGLSNASVAENQPAGTIVGALSATDADATDTPTFSLVPGAGDNAAFTITGATLRTAAAFDFEAKSSYAIRVRVDDGHGGSFERMFAIAVTDVDDAPTLATSAGATPFTENDPATVVDPGLTLADADDANQASATVQLTVGLHTGDLLELAPQAGISASYDAATGLLHLTGTATKAAYQAALRSVTFRSTSDAPGTVRTATFTADDGRLASAPATKAIAVTPVNDAPAITTSSGPIAYTEADPPTPIDPGLLLSDPDSQIAGATVTLTGNHATGQDVLALPAQPGITASYDSASGRLTLAGTASVAAYETALRAVTYADTSNNPATAARTVTFLATDDAAAASAPATRDITVGALDNPPDVTTSPGALAYTENDPPAAIDAVAMITDPDSANLTGATVQITGGYVAGEDVLALPAQPNVTGSFDAATGRLTLSGTASVADYQTALQAVTFADTSDDPSTLARTVTFVARDAGGFGLAATHGVTVAAVDDPPVAVADSATVTEDAGAAAVDVLANDTDVDGGPKAIGAVTQPAHGTVAVTGGGSGLTYTPAANYCNSQAGGLADTFSYTLTPGGATATVSVTVTCVDDPPVAVADSATVTEDAGAAAVDVLANDTDVDGGPKAIGAVTQPAHGTVAVTGGGSGLTYTPAANYCNSQAGGLADTFSYTLTPGGATATVSVTVTCVDDPPVAVADSATVTEDAGAAAVDVLANDTDVDGGPKAIGAVTQPAHGTVAVTGGGSGLTYTPAANYCNTETGGAADAFTYTLAPGGSTATVSMTVTCQPDPPVVATSIGSLAYTENDVATPIDPGLTASDPDPDAMIVSATVALTNNYAGAEDVLALGGGAHPGIAASLSGATLTLSGSALPSDYQAALRDVTYRDASDNPSTLPRTATFTITDETARTASASRNIGVTAVDDPPVAVDDTPTVLEDEGTTAIAVLANDTDVDGGPKSIASATQPTNGTVAVTGGGTGLTYTPAANYCNDPGNLPDSFTYELNGGSTATVLVTVTCVNDAPVAGDDTFSGASGAIGNTALAVNAPGDGPPPVTGPNKAITGNILANDTDVDGPNPLSVVAGTFSSHDGGTVVMQSDGDFVFTPAPGCSDTSDFFDYTVTDGNTPVAGTDVGQVNVDLTGCVWYVSNNAPGDAGTSTAPFDTLAEAQAASAAGSTLFVYKGDGTAAGYGAGITLKANQQLVGEAAGLDVGSDHLLAADATKRPLLAAAGADVVTLASGDAVRGLQLDPSGAGGGIFGGAGVAGGTIDDIKVIDTATAGTQPEVELNGTSGTFTITGLTIDDTAATAPVATGLLLAANTGTVDFGSTSVATAGGRAIDASGTNMGTSTFDSVTTTGSPAGGVSLVNTTGSTTFGDGSGTDLDLTTSSGAAAAFRLSGAGNVTVPSGGTANVSATGGPAIDVTGTGGATLSFDNVSSINSSAAAITLGGLGTGTFSATGGSLSGFAGTAFDLSGGSGTISYGGTVGNGTGLSAHITGRTGGTDTISGLIADAPGAGGGIVVTGNSGGTTTFSGSTKALDTGGSDAVVMSSNTGHTLALTGGGLAVTTTAGKGIAATGGGTLVVAGAGNTIDTTTGVALNVTNTNIGASGVTLQHVSSNGAGDGILLDGTGASGSLTVTGSGGTCTAANTGGCSGGQIQNSAGADDSSAAPVGTGIVLENTLNPSLTRMWIHDASNYAIRGTSVSGLALANTVINGANGNNGTTPFDDSSVWFDNLTGSATVSNTFVSGGFEDNFRVVNTAGSLNRITFTSDTIGDNSAAGGNDGILLESSTTAGQLQGTVQSSTFTGAGGDLLQYDHNGSGSGDLVLTGNAFSNNHPGIATGGGGLTLTNGGTSGATTMSITGGNTFRDAVGNALTIAKATGTSTQTGTFSGNTIGVNGLANSGSAEGDALKLQTLGQGTSTWTVTNNTIRGYNNFGVELEAGGSASAQGGAINATITGNTIDQPGTTAGTLSLPKNGVHLNIGTVPGDTYQACAVIGGAGGLANSLASAGKPGDDGMGNLAGGEDVRLRQRQSTTLRLPGYSGASTDTAAVQAFVAANNPSGGPTVATSVNSPPGGGFTGTGSTCP